MDKKVKIKWLKALRSGEYKQGAGSLHEETVDGENKFCCLGVLCDLADKEKNIIQKVYTIGDEPHKHYDGESGTLPPSIRKWAGLADANPFVVSLNNTIAELNDGGMTFNKLAALIEENF